MSARKPNVLIIFTDQLQAGVLPAYGGDLIATPNLDRLAERGTVFDSAMSNCPLCGPARAVLLTGRHPQTTGHIHNYIRMRHDELTIADAFARAGYLTSFVGKWHLYTGACPISNHSAWIPEGRERFGFEHFRAYNYHHEFFDGHLTPRQAQPGVWQMDRWDGYETEALPRYAWEGIDNRGDRPFLMCLAPHQPHPRNDEHIPFAPQRFYDALPADLQPAPNVPEHMYVNNDWPGGGAVWALGHYLPMVLALDEMVGAILDGLEQRGLADDTIIVFTSDHGSMLGAHGIVPWKKQRPYEEAARVPMIAAGPGVASGRRTDAPISLIDLMPTLSALCDVPTPRTVQGRDCADLLAGLDDNGHDQAVFCSNFTNSADNPIPGNEWRLVRTRRHSYTVWREKPPELYDLRADPLQQTNLAQSPDHADTLADMHGRLSRFQADLRDELLPASDYLDWFDPYRRVVRNALGPLPHPETPPDLRLLSPQ